jgi:hypothetical protein
LFFDVLMDWGSIRVAYLGLEQEDEAKGQSFCPVLALSLPSVCSKKREGVGFKEQNEIGERYGH